MKIDHDSKNEEIVFLVHAPMVQNGLSVSYTAHAPPIHQLSAHALRTLTLSRSPPLPQTQIARCDHGDPPNDHAIVHNSAHRQAMAFKPFSTSSLHPCASTDASAASVPLPIARPQPTTITDTRIHDVDLSRPRPIRGETISPPIFTEPLPLAFE